MTYDIDQLKGKLDNICDLRLNIYQGNEQMMKEMMKITGLLKVIAMASFLAFNFDLHAETSPGGVSAENQSFTDKVNNLKEQVLELNRDLFILEEELLFPVNTQVNVFISIDSGFLFELDSVQLKIDDKVVSNYLYTEREIQALHRGGVQRLYIGNMTTGEHELVAIFIGKGPSDRDYKRASTISISKTEDAKFIELKIKSNISKEQPEFSIKVWE